jgi:molybdopterin molybdotransferase
MVSIQEAREIVEGQARSFGSEEVELGAAFGRVLAQSVRADRDYPPFPRATVDGYALRFNDLERGIRQFRVIGTLLAGSESIREISAGDCYKIMTGAAVPGDADMVVRREDVEEKGNEMVVGPKEPEPWRSFLNIARQAEDLRAADRVIDRPCRCGPAIMGLLATLGCKTVKVAKLPRVAVITTGDEIVEPGKPVSAVQIRNSNRWMLEGALRGEGLGVEQYGHANDNPEALANLIGRSLAFDMVILTGGVSAGDADHVPGVLTALGVRPLFHKIAMRPGKPTWCGVAPEGGMVFALPGNPFSCLVNFALLIKPYIYACWGLERPAPLSLPLAGGRKKRTPLDEFFPVRMEGSPARLTQMPLNGSGDIRLGMQANALALHPAGAGDLGMGADVMFYCFE